MGIEAGRIVTTFESDSERNPWNKSVLGITGARRQHAVPRFFPRKFRDESEPTQIGNLERYIDFESGENVAAVRNNFYDIDLNGITVSTETWLSGVERKATLSSLH